MKCPSKDCTEEMVHRTGKFGGFWYCRKHGTISDKGMAIIEKIRESSSASGKIYSYSDNPNNDPLMLQIERQTLEFGVMPTELEKWIVDHPGAADWEEDHWLNSRPY